MNVIIGRYLYNKICQSKDNLKLNKLIKIQDNKNIKDYEN